MKFGPHKAGSCGLYMVRFPDHYKIGMSTVLPNRISKHRLRGAEVICWVEVPERLVGLAEEGLIYQSKDIHKGAWATERFHLTDVQVARVQHRMMKWRRALMRGLKERFR